MATIILFFLNNRKVNNLLPFIIIGIFLWVFVLKSGIHASLAGVLLAQFIPLGSNESKDQSPLHKLEHSIEPWLILLSCQFLHSLMQEFLFLG